MANSEGRTELEELGEFGLIQHLAKHVEIKNKSTALGIGDDAALINPGKKQLVLTTDMLVEGVHFDLTYTPLKHLGYKAVVVNISDVCAMNATSSQITVSIALSNRFSLEAIEELYAGIMLACKNYNVDLVGGDTTSSLSGLIISVTATGFADKKDMVLRSTAKEHDLMCVTGDLGGAYMGLQLLEREKTVFQADENMQPDLEGNDYILERQLKPEARTDIIKLFKELKVKPTSMIDISDGLSSEALHICHSSDVGCNIYEEKIPLDHQTIQMAHEFKIDPSICALSGGEDYELLFTVNQKDHDKIKGNPNITIIGHITSKAEGCQLIGKGDVVHELTAQGWDSLLKKN